MPATKPPPFSPLFENHVKTSLQFLFYLPPTTTPCSVIKPNFGLIFLNTPGGFGTLQKSHSKLHYAICLHVEMKMNPLGGLCARDRIRNYDEVVPASEET